MFDTHCHLNFKAYKKTLDEVISQAQSAGVKKILIPGTDVKTSRRAIEIAEQYDWMYVAVGIHPHHVYKLLKRDASNANEELAQIEELAAHQKVVAIGEIGMDRHEYTETVYAEYNVDERFVAMQKELFIKQMQLAIKLKKSLILHNREAVGDILPLIEENWDQVLEGRTVFHCCEPRQDLLDFAKKHKMYLGVDGDITFITEKQEFIPTVPSDMLVLETDSPFLLPEPLRSQKRYPNKPSHITIVAETVAKLRKVTVDELVTQTSTNAEKLFNIA